MKHLIRLPLIGLLLLTTLPVARAQEKAKGFDRWEKDVAAYEAQDKASPPPKGQILFIGSSTIVRWKSLADDFPEHKTINRGFGGSQIADAAHFADRLVIPHAPRLVFLRAGGNDLWAGKSSEQVFADYIDFVAKVQGKLPDTTITFISLSPSIARWKQADKEKAVNDMVKQFIAGKPKLKYIETYDMVLGSDGQPRAELLVEDKLHFNGEGYKLLVERVRPYLTK